MLPARLTAPEVAAAESRERLLERRAAARARPPRPPRARTARERAERLLDPGSFTELGPLRRGPGTAGEAVDGDGVVTGFGTIDGRSVVVVSHDFSHAGGSIGAAFAEKVVRVQELAAARGWPVVYLNDSGGARIHEGILALHGCGRIMAANVRLRALVPQVSVVLGPCAGAAAYSPALTDWTIMVAGAGRMFLTGPEVVRAATGERVDPEELGGAAVHTRESGVAHLEAADEEEALALVRRLLGFLPSRAGGALPVRPAVPPPADAAAALPHAVPAAPGAPFDVGRVLDGILDAGERLELAAGHAPSVRTLLARLDGVPVGVVASQPARRGGILDARAAVKAARLVEFCGRFGLPILTFVDVPGFLPGAAEERRGVIACGASLLAAYAAAPVPRLTVVLRKAYGGAYIALGSRAIGADLAWAWPQAEMAVMGPEATVGILHRRELAAAPDPAARRRELAARYRAAVTSPFVAAEAGIVDDVILPEETRDRLVAGLRLVRGAP
jgi:acetyl-CoA/propionyl-CoA carboxylase carboxyl transferase subunit